MLKVLNDEIMACTKCEDLVHNRNKPVLGHGNVNAKIMLVGECPGKSENSEGIPFVGKAGRLLNNILAAFNIKREEVYITNTCHCWPPQNRTPTREEIKNCSSFLDREIEIINPKYIVCLGTVAAQRILNVDTPIGKLRKKIYIVNGRKIFAFYHPSYLLRNPPAKKDMYEDFNILIDEIKCNEIGAS